MRGGGAIAGALHVACAFASLPFRWRQSPSLQLGQGQMTTDPDASGSSVGFEWLAHAKSMTDDASFTVATRQNVAKQRGFRGNMMTISQNSACLRPVLDGLL